MNIKLRSLPLPLCLPKSARSDTGEMGGRWCPGGGGGGVWVVKDVGWIVFTHIG